jgi:hypothetical protein
MGALNAVPLVVVSRADAFSVLSPGEQYVMGGLFLGYAALVLTFMLGAIEALRPGRFCPALSDWPDDSADRPVGNPVLRGHHPAVGSRELGGVADGTRVAAQRRAGGTGAQPRAEEPRQAHRAAPALRPDFASWLWHLPG